MERKRERERKGERKRGKETKGRSDIYKGRKEKREKREKKRESQSSGHQKLYLGLKPVWFNLVTEYHLLPSGRPRISSTRDSSTTVSAAALYEGGEEGKDREAIRTVNGCSDTMQHTSSVTNKWLAC